MDREMDEDRILRAYEAHFPLWQAFGSRLRLLLEDAIGPDPNIYSIENRIKPLSSVIQKLEAKGAVDLSEIQDIIGIRILVSEPSDVRRVVVLLSRELELHEEEAFSWVDEPRYKAAHLLITIGGNRGNLPEWRRFEELKAEVQVQTLLAFHWSQVEHYKLGGTASANAATRLRAGITAADQLDSTIDQFETLLDKPDVHERRDIHRFLDAHQFILHPNPEAITSEVAIGIGTQYIMDFVIREPDGNYLLVEIENPRHMLLNKNGDFSAIVGHAQLQIETWQEWIEDNLPTAQKKLIGISSPRGLLVIGRSKGSTEAERRKLARRNISLRSRILIQTYDDLIAGARSYVASIRRHMKA